MSVAETRMSIMISSAKFNERISCEQRSIGMVLTTLAVMPLVRARRRARPVAVALPVVAKQQTAAFGDHMFSSMRVVL